MSRNRNDGRYLADLEREDWEMDCMDCDDDLFSEREEQHTHGGNPNNRVRINVQYTHKRDRFREKDNKPRRGGVRD